MRFTTRPTLRRLQFTPAAFRAEVPGIDQRDVVFARECFGALARQHHVRRMFHHRACQQHGIAHVADPRDGTRAQRRAIHDRRVQFAELGETGAKIAGDHMIRCIARKDLPVDLGGL